MKDFIIGIDPGRNGGIVGLTNGKINVIDKMPQQPESLWGYFVDVLGIPMMKERNNIYVYIEDVHSMPTDGARSAFTFGRHLGWWDMLLSHYNLTFSRVLPRDWQQSYDLQRRKNETPPESKYQYKKRILEKSKTLVDKDHKEALNLATCDAYLIALYGYNQLKERKS